MGLFSILRGGSYLYFPGCYSFYKYKEKYELIKQIFSKLGINFKEADIKICCGLIPLELGYETDARRFARRNFEIIKETGVNAIITECPNCQKMFQEDYKNFIPEWNFEIINLYKLIFDKLDNKQRLIKTQAVDLVTFQDNCYLGSYLGIYDEPRKILELIGYEIRELQNNKTESICSGSCGCLNLTNPDLAEKLAREKILQVKRIGVNKIVVTSLEDYELLKKNSEKTDIEVLYFFDLLAKSLGIEIEETPKYYDEIIEEEKLDDQNNEEEEIYGK